jgi:hypothetical protein
VPGDAGPENFASEGKSCLILYSGLSAGNTQFRSGGGKIHVIASG